MLHVTSVFYTIKISLSSKRYRFSANNAIKYYHTSRIFNTFIVSCDIYRFNKKKPYKQKIPLE